MAGAEIEEDSVEARVVDQEELVVEEVRFTCSVRDRELLLKDHNKAVSVTEADVEEAEAHQEAVEPRGDVEHREEVVAAQKAGLGPSLYAFISVYGDWRL